MLETDKVAYAVRSSQGAFQFHIAGGLISSIASATEKASCKDMSGIVLVLSLFILSPIRLQMITRWQALICA